MLTVNKNYICCFITNYTTYSGYKQITPTGTATWQTSSKRNILDTGPMVRKYDIFEKTNDIS